MLAVAVPVATAAGSVLVAEAAAVAFAEDVVVSDAVVLDELSAKGCGASSLDPERAVLLPSKCRGSGPLKITPLSKQPTRAHSSCP